MSRKKNPNARAKNSIKQELPSADEALFVIPARLTRPFFTQLYAICEEKIFDHFQEQVRPVVRAVCSTEAQFDAQAVNRILEREFLMNPGRIKFLIVVPTNSKELSVGVEKVASKYQVPVIALTLPFHRWPKPKGNSQPRRACAPPVVLCNSVEGTKQLSKVAAMELERMKIKRPVDLWVLPGSRRIDSISRINGFVSGLREEGVELVRGEPHRLGCGNWLRRVAYELMLQAIKNRSQEDKENGKPTPVDIVFAANDEMALGVRDAVRESNRSVETAPITGDCLIFGFDAISEAHSLIRKNNGDRWLKGTVEQQLPEMASNLVQLMESIRKGDEHFKGDEVTPLAIFHLDVEEELAARDAYPDHVPSFTAARYISEEKLAEQLKIKVASVRKYRGRGEKTSDEIGQIGRDERGYIYRTDSAGECHYLLGSVLKVLNRKR